MTPDPRYPTPPYSYTREEATPRERERYRKIVDESHRYYWNDLYNMACAAPSLEEARAIDEAGYRRYRNEEAHVFGP